MRRTHTVDVFRDGHARVANPLREERSTAASLTLACQGVRCNLQPGPGGLVIEQQEGVTERGKWRGFFPPSTDVRTRDFIIIRAGPGTGSRFEVTQVGPQGSPWDTEVEMENTVQQFGAG